MIVRNMTADDVAEVAKIERACFSQPWSERAFFEELDNPYGVTLVADIDGKIGGFLNVRDVMGEIFINNIAVSEEFRRQGAGRELLCQLEKRKFDFITLEVRESNLGAIKLYESCGYEKVGMRKNFYEKPCENAVLMTKFSKKGEIDK